MRNKEIELKEPETKSQSEARMVFKTPIRKQEMVKNKGSTHHIKPDLAFELDQ